MTSHQHQEHSPSRPRSNIVLLVFLGIAGFYLVTEHTAHLFGVLPYLLLLLCPLMHLLHGGHGGGHSHRGSNTSQTEGEKQ